MASRPDTTTTYKPAPGSASDAERRAWQREAAEVLTRILKLSAARKLPVISWTVSNSGAGLTGECFAHPYSGRRAQFAAWSAVLGKPDTAREYGIGDGAVRLVATWDVGHGQLPEDSARRPLLTNKMGFQVTTVSLIATILPELDEGDQASGTVAPDSPGLRQLGHSVRLEAGQ